MGKKQVPAIRFQGFTDAWEQRKLGDVADIVGGGTPSTGNPSYWDGDIDWYAPAEIADQIYANSSQKKITDLGYANSSAKMLPPGTVLFTSRAGIGKTAILTRKGCTNQGFQSIVPHRGELDTYFIFSRTEELKRYGELVGAGSTFVEVSGKQMVVMELMMPPTMREQQTIGGFFQQLDHLITLHQRKYEKLLKVKKSMLEKMFPRDGTDVPEIRFDGFTDAWEQRKLGDVCEIKDSARIPNSEWTESGVPYIRASDVTNENIDGVLFISQERYEFYKNRTGAPTKDDVLFNGGGEIGKCLLIADENPIYVQGGAVLYACTSESSKLVGQYLKIYFETTHAKSYIDTASAGGTMKHFTLKPSQMMPILIPSVDEQEKLGTYFSNLDHLITLHQRELEKLKNIKKSLLEKMFV